MISKMSLLQYLSEETYQTICDRLDLDGSGRKIKGNFGNFRRHSSAAFILTIFNMSSLGKYGFCL